MTLRERLAKAPKKEVVYAGCKDGSAFFFIGTAEEFSKYIGIVDQDTQKKYQDVVAKRQSVLDKLLDDEGEAQCNFKMAQEEELWQREQVKNALEDPDRRKALAREEKRHIETLKKLEDAESILTKVQNRVESNRRRYEKRVEQLRTWIPLIDREIVEEYGHTSGTPGPTCLVDGDIESNFWMYDECRHWMNAQDEKEKTKKEEGKNDAKG